MNELISIIVPIYNVEDYVTKCIKSIMEQTYSNLEIFLVDDGSTDASGTICDQYAFIDSRITVVHTKNCGVTHARKEGLKLAKGQFIGFVDGDDYIEKDYYKQLVNKMCSADYDFVQSGTIYEYEGKEFLIALQEDQSYDIEGKQIDMLCEGLLGKRQKVDLLANSLCVRLFKAEKIKECMYLLSDDLIYGEDMVCMCRYIMQSNKFVILKGAGYHYVQRKSSAMHTMNIGHLIKNCKLYEQVLLIFTISPYYERVKELMSSYFMKEVTSKWRDITGKDIALYEFPDIHMLFGKRVILYGAGKVGMDYYKQICRYEQCRIAAVADTHYEKYHYDYVRVVRFSEIKKLQWDILIISVLGEEISGQIKSFLVQNGIEKEKIYWCSPKQVYGFDSKIEA